jgi:cytoskeletal protein CcmA (bactofilin family)
MSRKHDLLGVSAAETIIGAGVKLKGNLAGDGDMMIDGLISGNLKSAGNITIGVNAIVKADIEATNVVILGQVDGNIKAPQETRLGETGRVKGNITTANLAIASGAIFAGSSTMTQANPREIPDKEAGTRKP